MCTKCPVTQQKDIISESFINNKCSEPAFPPVLLISHSLRHFLSHVSLCSVSCHYWCPLTFHPTGLSMHKHIPLTVRFSIQMIHMRPLGSAVLNLNYTFANIFHNYIQMSWEFRWVARYMWHLDNQNTVSFMKKEGLNCAWLDSRIWGLLMSGVYQGSVESGLCWERNANSSQGERHR